MRQSLFEYRKTHGFTQDEMAEKLGISKSFYSRIENGERRLVSPAAKKILEVTGINLMEEDFENDNESNGQSEDLGN